MSETKIIKYSVLFYQQRLNLAVFSIAIRFYVLLKNSLDVVFAFSTENSVRDHSICIEYANMNENDLN